jgi:cytosine/adenosine deaminase-related metal-dependent hydrolase
LSGTAAGRSSVYIANARLVRPDAGNEPRAGGVLVEGNSIAAVALTDREQRDTRARAGEVIDAAGMILMPGLVNAHYHSYGTLLKGTEKTACRSSHGRSIPWPTAGRSARRRFGWPSCSAPPR